MTTTQKLLKHTTLSCLLAAFVAQSSFAADATQPAGGKGACKKAVTGTGIDDYYHPDGFIHHGDYAGACHQAFPVKRTIKLISKDVNASAIWVANVIKEDRPYCAYIQFDNLKDVKLQLENFRVAGRIEEGFDPNLLKAAFFPVRLLLWRLGVSDAMTMPLNKLVDYLAGHIQLHFEFDPANPVKLYAQKDKPCAMDPTETPDATMQDMLFSGEAIFPTETFGKPFPTFEQGAASKSLGFAYRLVDMQDKHVDQIGQGNRLVEFRLQAPLAKENELAAKRGILRDIVKFAGTNAKLVEMEPNYDLFFRSCTTELYAAINRTLGKYFDPAKKKEREAPLLFIPGTGAFNKMAAWDRLPRFSMDSLDARGIRDLKFGENGDGVHVINVGQKEGESN